MPLMEKIKCFITGSTDIINGGQLENQVPISQKGMDLLNKFTYSAKNASYAEHMGSKEKKGIIKSDRKFGAELECGTKSELNRRVGMFLVNPLHVFSSDGSVNAPARTELKTCPLQGKEGEEELTRVCNLLKGTKHFVNISCGTHCHIGVPEAREKDDEETQLRLKNLLYLYLTIDNVLISLLPEDRRNNGYCARLSRSVSDLFDFISRKPSELLAKEVRYDRAWYRHNDLAILKAYKDQRYGGRSRYGMNFSSIYQRGTLEVRYHEGTLDPERLIHWIAFHTALVDAVMSGVFTEEMIRQMGEFKSTKRLLNHILSLLMLNRLVKTSTINAINRRYKEFAELNKGIDAPEKEYQEAEDMDGYDEDYDDDSDDDDDSWL